MSIGDISNLFSFVGGLGMFLYGMRIMGDGMQKTAGSKMNQFLGMVTNNRLLGVALGALITAILQCSDDCYGGWFCKCGDSEPDAGSGSDYGCEYRYHNHSLDGFVKSAGGRFCHSAAGFFCAAVCGNRRDIYHVFQKTEDESGW